jgi:pyruvate/2-oxoglutarate/acetoin dehydrogenase E1 component
MNEISYRQAINLAIAHELEADPSVFLIGEDVAAAGGAFKVTDGLQARFGAARVLDTPISEQAIVGCAIGAAMRGLRPIVEIMFSDFAGVCFDQIANQAAKYRYMTDGQVSVPLTIRMANGGGAGFGAQHSQMAENWFLGVPGLKIAVPSTPADAYALLRAAVRDPDPVLYFEHKNLFNVKGPLPEAGADYALGGARIVRPGRHVTLAATQMMCYRALEAAAALSERGVEAEVVDLRVLAPLDVETVAASVARTHRLLCIQEGPPHGGWGATLVAQLARAGFELLDAPPRVLASDDTPAPFAACLEEAHLPTAERIAHAASDLAEY